MCIFVHICTCIYVCIDVCMYVDRHACIYACLYACMLTPLHDSAWIDVGRNVCLCAWIVGWI